MKPKEIIEHPYPEYLLNFVFDRLHQYGPIRQQDMEILSYFKIFHKEVFDKAESRLMFLLGNFYKTDEPKDLLSLSYSIYKQSIFSRTGQYFTPIQDNIYHNILNNTYFSFSAPTSTGKSYLFRELIKNEDGDVVIVVPSRALIAEYIYAVKIIVENNNEILVLQFIEDINKKKTTRRVFVVTPERASEVFKNVGNFNFTLFLFDEAQISEEKIRGVRFDALVRRISRSFPEAKKVFSHPFIENPEAQLQKHGIEREMGAKSYIQSTVGKIFLNYKEVEQCFYYFSPNTEGAHLKKNQEKLDIDIVQKTLESDGTMLVYITKKSIYDKTFISTFNHYISLCLEISDPKAIEIIDEIEELIGAKHRESEMIKLMRRGIVIHHGSIPLAVRFLIEKFTNNNYAKICFATATLAQGVNMPFDIVWIENVRFEGSDEDKTLALKNLIGRAGRSTTEKNSFDYGYVIVRNVKRFCERFNGITRLNSESYLDKEQDSSLPDDLTEFIDAVKTDDMDDTYDLPNQKTDRMIDDEVFSHIETTLNYLFVDGVVIKGNTYRDLPDHERQLIKDSFRKIYETSLGRELFTGEKTIISTSIMIMLWQIEGKSFKELLSLRYGYLTNMRLQTELRQKYRNNEISLQQLNESLDNIPISYSPIPYSLPNSTLKNSLPSRYQRKKLKDFNYDLLVYDTYDFIDKIISFSLSNVYVAAYDLFYRLNEDGRAKMMTNYFRYGTIDETEIWLIRYGLSIEDAEKIKEYVISINEDEIVLDKDFANLDENLISIVERYI